MGERGLIAIRWPSGKKALIAREDYDPNRDTLWEAPEAPQAAADAPAMPEVVPERKRRGRTHRG